MSALTGNLYQMTQGDYRLPTVRPRVVEEDKEQIHSSPSTSVSTADTEAKVQTPTQAQLQDATRRIESALDAVRRWRGEDYNFTPNEALAIQTLALGPDPDTAVHKFIAASSLSAMSGIDTATVYANLDTISQWYTGEGYQPNDATLSQKVFAAREVVDIPKAQEQWQKAVINGDTETSKRLESEILARLEAIDGIQGGLPYSLLDKIISEAIGNFGYIADVTSAAGTASLATTIALTGLVTLSSMNPVAAGIAMAAVPTFASAAGATASFIETASLAEASTFWDLMHTEDGIQDPVAANFLATVNGIVTGATEAFMDGITARGVSKVAGKYTDQIGISMLVDYFGTKAGSRWARSLMGWTSGWVDEAMLNEFPQQISDYLVNSAYRHAIGLPSDIDLSEMLDEATVAAINGALVGMVYGGLGVPAEMANYRGTSLELRRDANTTFSREAFFEKTDRLKPEDVSQEAFDEARSKIFDAARKQQADAWAERHEGTVLESEEIAAEELFVQIDSEGNPINAPDGSINRTNGRLYAEERKSGDTTTVYFGDRDTGSIYGSISFTEGKDSISIESVRVASGYENIRAEMLQQTFADYGMNKEIQWDPTTKGLQAVKQSLIDNNPDGTGLNYKASSVKANTQTLADSIQKEMPGLSRPEALVSARLYLLADRGTLSSINNGQIFGNAEADRVDLAGQRGATNIAKGLIYAGQHADVSTFTHELFHAVANIRPAEKEELSNAVKATLADTGEREKFKTFLEDHKEIWGNRYNLDEIVSSLENLTNDWTRVQEENLARLYEAYRSSESSQRQSVPERIRTVLQRLADFMNRVYSTLKDSTPLNENIARAYDKLMGIEGKPSSSASTRTETDAIRYQRDKSEIVEKINNLLNSAPLSNHIEDNIDYTLSGRELKKNALEWARNNVVGTYHNADSDIDIMVTRKSLKEIIRHDTGPQDGNQQLKSLSYLPEIIENSIYIGEATNESISTPIDRFDYYLSIIDIDGTEYAVKSVIGQKDGQVKYYDQKLTNKEGIAERGRVTSPGYSLAPSSDIKDKRLLIILQDLLGLETAQDYSNISSATESSDSNTNIRFQSDDGQTAITNNLFVSHSISESKLQDSIELGGFVMPSLGITKPEAELVAPLAGFGGITLIGSAGLGRRLVREGAVYDRDMWSPVFPRPEYRINESGIQEFLDKVIAESKIDKRDYNLKYLYEDQYRSPEDMADRIAGRDSFKEAFLKASGIDVEPVMAPIDTRPYPVSLILKTQEWMEDNKDMLNEYAWSSDTVSNAAYDALSPYFLDAFKETRKGGLFVQKWVDRLGWEGYFKEYSSGYRRLDMPNLLVLAKRYSPEKLEMDSTATSRALDERIREIGNDKYREWLASQIEPFYTNPHLKAGRRSVPYNAQGILEYMSSQRRTGNDGQFGQRNLSNATASAARPLTDMASLHNAESLLAPRPDYKAMQDSLAALARKSSRQSNPLIAMDDISGLLGEYLEKTDNTSTAKARTIMRRGALNVTDETVHDFVTLAEELRNMARPYFEAKPETILQLSDFAAAVVPDTVSESTVKALEDAGLEIIPAAQGAQAQAVVDYVNENSSLRFQDEYDRSRYSGIFRRADPTYFEADGPEFTLEPETYDDAMDTTTAFSPEITSQYVPYEEDNDFGGIDPADPAVWATLVKDRSEIRPSGIDYYRMDCTLDQVEHTYEEAMASMAPNITYSGTDSEKDAIFTEAVNGDALFGYLKVLGESTALNTVNKNAWVEKKEIRVYPFVDQAHREDIQRMVRTRVDNANLIRLATMVNTKQKDYTDDMVAKARAELTRQDRLYRDLFADLIGDKDMKPHTLIRGRLKVQSETPTGFRSISELAKIASDAGLTALSKKLENGTLTMGEEDMALFRQLSQGYSDLKKQIAASQRQNKKLGSDLDSLRSEMDDWKKNNEAVNKELDTAIYYLTSSMPRDDSKAFREQFADIQKEYDDLSEANKNWYIDQRMPSDGRSRRSDKIRRAAIEHGEYDWLKDIEKKYGYSSIKEIERRREELKALIDAAKPNYVKNLAGKLRNRTADANARIADLSDQVEKLSTESSAKEDLKKEINSLKGKLNRRDKKIAQLESAGTVAQLRDELHEIRAINRDMAIEFDDRLRNMETAYSKMLEDERRRADSLFEIQDQRDAMRAFREEKMKYAREIMDPVNINTTDWETGGRAILAIQALVDPAFRRDWVYSLETNLEGVAGGETMTIEQAKAYLNSLDDADRRAVSEAINPKLLARLTEQKKPLNDWTMAELKEMAQNVADLRRLGRETLKAKREFLRLQASGLISEALDNLRSLGADERRNFPSSQEFKDHRRNARAKLAQMDYATRRPMELAELLDGGYGNHGVAYNLLVDEKRYHQSRALRKINERLASIEPLVTKEIMRKLGKTTTIDFGDGYKATFTMDDLGYIYLSQFEEDNAAAVAFGNLLTAEEKGTRGKSKGINPDGSIDYEYLSSGTIADDDILAQTGLKRYGIAVDHARMVLQEEGLMPLVDAIAKDFGSQTERLQQMMVDVYNHPMRIVEHYLPIRRSDLTGEDLAADFADAYFNTNNSGIMHNPEKGFTITRVKIPARHQSSVNLSLFSVWQRNVFDQEWLIENAAYQRKLHRVFMNKELANAIGSAYTPDLYQEINDYINLLANPNRGTRKTGSERTVRELRGNLAAAYLGWKASGIVMQAITSPMPFLAEVSPARLIKAYIDIAGDYDGILSEIQDKSVMMKNRSMNPIVDELASRVNQVGNKSWQNAVYKFQEIGMKGLEWVDQTAVAGGWLAKYNQVKENSLEKGFSTAAAEAAAVKAADDFVLKYQPTGDATEMASMFRTQNEYAKAILQFQASLNVIWNNITADLQGHWRNREYRKVVGTISGYMLAGLLLGLVQTGFDDDEEPEEKALDAAYFALTQFTDSVPWVGSEVTSVIQKYVTGKTDWYGSTNLFPAADSLFSALKEGRDLDFAKAAKYLGQTIGYTTGLPVSGVKQVLGAITDLDPGRLLGRN